MTVKKMRTMSHRSQKSRIPSASTSFGPVLATIMRPSFQFTIARMLTAAVSLAGAAVCLRFLFVEPRLIGTFALLTAASLVISAAAVLARGKEGFVWALVICFASSLLCLFAYLLVYTLFFDIPRDIRRQTGRRRVITMAPSAGCDCHALTVRPSAPNYSSKTDGPSVLACGPCVWRLAGPWRNLTELGLRQSWQTRR